MNNIKRIALMSLCIVFLSFLAWSFYYVSFNIVVWGLVGRGAYLTLTLLFVGIVVSIDYVERN